MKAFLLSPQKDLIAEIISCLEFRGSDYSMNMVVFPGRRPAHFLRKGLARRTGSSFIPPALFSMDDFVDSLFERDGPGRKLDTVDAAAVLYEIHKKTRRPLGGSSFMNPDSFFPLGLKIYRDIEELYIEGISLQKVKDIQPYADEAVPPRTIERLQSLSFFYEEFYKAIEERGFSTRSVRYRAAAERIDHGRMEDFRKIIIAGFFAFTRSENAIIKKLLQADNTLFFFQDGPGIREKVAGLGVQAEREESERSLPDVRFYRSPDSHGQVFALSRAFGDAAAADTTTAIVLPSSDSLFPLLRQGLPGLDDSSYNVSLGYPLLRTPVFGFLNNLMELVSSMDGERVYIADYLKFVLHPYTKNIYFRESAETTRILFHAIEEGLTKNRTKTFSSLSGIEEDERLLRLVMDRLPGDQDATQKDIRQHLRSIHRNTIERFLSFENVRDFAEKCTGVLIYIFNNSTARLHPLFQPFAESFIRSLDLLSRSLMKDVAFAERSSYFTFLRKYAMTCRTPFEGTPLRGLQVLGFLETRNLKFDRIFVLDVNEDSLPDTKREDTLLPFRARQILGLPTYMDRDRLSEYYFETLIWGAKEVHLFFIENDTKERSRFVERLLWEKQKKDKTTEAARYINTVQYRVKLRNSGPAEVRKSGEAAAFLKGFTYSATSLDRYLECPLGFYYSYVLGIDRKEEISGGIERADIGKFVHKAVSEYFSKKMGYILKERDISIDEMDRVAETLFKSEYGEDPAGALYLLKRQLKGRLRDLLGRYYLPLVKERPVIILSSEEKITASIGSFSLRGRLDSVEKRGEKTFIVDYKTGSNPAALRTDFERLDSEDRTSWHEAIGSLQLPFYLLLYSTVRGAAIEDLECLFLLLGRSSAGSEMELPLFGGSDPAQTFGVLKRVIFGLLGEIVDQEVPFRASEDRKRTCPGCEFMYLCGTQWIGR